MTTLGTRALKPIWNCRHFMPSTWVHFLAVVAAADSLEAAWAPATSPCWLFWCEQSMRTARLILHTRFALQHTACPHLTSDSVKSDYTAPPWLVSNVHFGVCQEQQTCLTFPMSQWCLPFSKYPSKPNSNCRSGSQKSGVLTDSRVKMM